jgi:ElaB/YqjD/DUF883 family membrane-anchored ribosome-binding protein
MKKNKPAIDDDLSQLAEDARALMAATADVAGESVVNARRRVAATLERGPALYDRVRAKTVAGARKADATVREHPYQAIGIALSLGTLVGFVGAHLRARHDN